MADRAFSLLAGALGGPDRRGLTEVAFDVVDMLTDEEIDELIDDVWTDPVPASSEQRRAIASEIMAAAGAQILTDMAGRAYSRDPLS